MRYFVLTYDPVVDSDPVIQAFDDASEAFTALRRETLTHLGRDGVEVVVFYCDSEETLRAANHRYFNPSVTKRLRDQPDAVRRDMERSHRKLANSLAVAVG